MYNIGDLILANIDNGKEMLLIEDLCYKEPNFLIYICRKLGVYSNGMQALIAPTRCFVEDKDIIKKIEKPYKKYRTKEELYMMDFIDKITKKDINE